MRRGRRPCPRERSWRGIRAGTGGGGGANDLLVSAMASHFDPDLEDASGQLVLTVMRRGGSRFCSPGAMYVPCARSSPAAGGVPGPSARWGRWRGSPLEGGSPGDPPRRGRRPGRGTGADRRPAADPRGRRLPGVGGEGPPRAARADVPLLLRFGRRRRRRPGRMGRAPLERSPRAVDHRAPPRGRPPAPVPLHVERATAGMPPHDLVALGLSLPLWSVVPFAGTAPVDRPLPPVRPSLWARHYAKVCLAFGVPVASFFLLRAPRELLHTVIEYASFLILLASLFTISGGSSCAGRCAARRGSTARSWPSGRCSRTSSGRQAPRCSSSVRCCGRTRTGTGRPTSSSSSSSWWRTSAGRSPRSAIRPCSSATCGGCRSSGRCARWACCGPPRSGW